ncbi:hypothetical protein LCGC14_0738780 [marine sediment metagenome]|uniref:Uncharacterized protein n=1 Tax=marine sediment metagenome TaxID=412755 RepID=A0A0F9TEM2_9ZZZZ
MKLKRLDNLILVRLKRVGDLTEEVIVEHKGGGMSAEEVINAIEHKIDGWSWLKCVIFNITGRYW